MAPPAISPKPSEEFLPPIKEKVSESWASNALTKSDFEKACEILDVIFRYQLNRETPIAPRDQPECIKFAALIYSQVKASRPVLMCLPAFPFKSPNSQSKVLGRLPDKAEELALAHINGLCAAITDIYPPGAELTIVSDGLVYNDLLGVPDKDVWAYGQSLRTLATTRKFKHIRFSRLHELLDTTIDEPELNEMAYVAQATDFRRSLLNQFGRHNWDPTTEINTKDDTCLTYKGYLKFLETDLEHVYPVGTDRSKKSYKNGIKHIARQMLYRGDAFARAVREKFPSHVRLSIHPSSSALTKISISLLPTSSVWTTPWHCAMAVMLDGGIQTGPRSQFENGTFELVTDSSGRPSHFREKSDLLSWGPVSVEPLYPCGLLITPVAGPGKLSIDDVDAKKVRALAELNSPVILRDFSKTTDRDLFVAKSHEMGTPTPWKRGLVLEVKELAGPNKSVNALTSERMPMHYDGLFKVEKRLAGKNEVVVPVPPNLQFFTAVTPCPEDTGYTLFASSNLFFRYATAPVTVEALAGRTWSVSTPSFDATNLEGLPLVTEHPVTGKSCIRYHEKWPQSKTEFDPVDVAIDGDDDGEVDKAIETLLYDRRVTYWHAWKKGDMLVSDNVSMMHTRTKFVSGCDRELWRIHVE
ncbi:hypothetical protein OQA88_7743 [Cercophora sp. LCS_1]